MNEENYSKRWQESDGNAPGYPRIYKVKFIGRHVGAIGAFAKISTTIKAETEEQARLKLYDEYEHIQQLEISEVR